MNANRLVGTGSAYGRSLASSLACLLAFLLDPDPAQEGRFDRDRAGRRPASERARERSPVPGTRPTETRILYTDRSRPSWGRGSPIISPKTYLQSVEKGTVTAPDDHAP
jgi:hypothetical protein